jgi:branched-chain amino acid transport system permease protein
MMFGIGASWLFPTVFKSVADFRMILYSLVLIAVMILRPQGLFGLNEVWDFWRRRGRA